MKEIVTVLDYLRKFVPECMENRGDKYPCQKIIEEMGIDVTTKLVDYISIKSKDSTYRKIGSSLMIITSENLPYFPHKSFIFKGLRLTDMFFDSTRKRSDLSENVILVLDALGEGVHFSDEYTGITICMVDHESGGFDDEETKLTLMIEDIFGVRMLNYEILGDIPEEDIPRERNLLLAAFTEDSMKMAKSQEMKGYHYAKDRK